MIRAARRTVFSVIVLGSLASITPALAQGLDISTLPRVSGAKLTYAGPTSTIYTTSGTVEQAAEAVTKALAAAGWQAYGDPSSQAAPNAPQRIMNFKKGPQAIVAFVSVAPAQGNATSVSYSANALANDLPFPKDATDIGFAPERPHLRAMSGETVAALLDFFRKDMTTLGYQPWTVKPEHISDKGALIFFTRDNQKILVLSLTRNDNGRTRIDMSPTTARVLTADRKPAIATETPEQAQAKAAAREGHERASAAIDGQINTQIDNVLRDVQQSLRTPPQSAPRSDGAVTAAPQPERKTAAAPKTTATQQFDADDLKVEVVAGYPVPKRRSSSGNERTPYRVTINATVPMDVATMLTFYRGALKERGWTEAQGASVSDARAQTAFTTPEGPATLTLERKDGDTQVRLALRKPDAAQKAGVLPKAGQAKVLLGNPNDSEAEVTINKQTFRVKPGAGEKNPDGPMLDLAPGKYQVSLKMGGQSANETIEVGANEAWGLLIGPGGFLPLQVY